MLRRLNWIRDGGYFDDFQWDSSLPDFERINVIYGSNGSGKSSLARVLDVLRSTDDGHLQASVSVADGTSVRTTDGRRDPVFNRLLVFNEEYVARSHRFRDGSADMEAVLTLGERTAEDEQQLERLRDEQKQLLDEQVTLIEEKEQLERQIDSAYTRVSQAVVSDASRAGGMYASRGKYSVAKVRSRLGQLRDQLEALEPIDLDAKKHLISGDNRDELPSSSLSMSIRDDLVPTAMRLLARTPVTIVLDTLKDNPDCSGWVQEGIALHSATKTCAFCGGMLTDDRRNQIERHFSDEVEQLQRELVHLTAELRTAEAGAESIASNIPASGLLFEDLRGSFEIEEQAVRSQITAFKEWCAQLRSKLAAKRENVLGTVPYDLSEPPVIDGSGLSRYRDHHNQRVTVHGQLVQEAAEAVELHHMKTEESLINALLEKQTAVETRLTEISGRLDEIDTDVVSLETAEGDPTPSAQVLTREVGRLLGRTELIFEPSGKRYRVLRQGRPASNLSVGEQTAITLVHFLETVAKFDATGGKPIVVIDDPVSSLDSNIFMGVSTYLWSAAISTAPVSLGQMFLLTHNFDLFRQWDIQLEKLHAAKGMATEFSAALYELRSRHVTTGGSPRRRPVLATWPESPAARKKMRSSYHHAFLLMAKAHQKLKAEDVLENRLDAQLLFPNLIRRVLESFLAFKRPELTGNFTEAMRKATPMLEEAGYKGDAAALRQQLTRYTHAYSHSETPDTNDVVNSDEIASALAAAFSFMRLLDDAHFRGLCDVVGVDPDQLAATLPTAGDWATTTPQTQTLAAVGTEVASLN